MTPQTARAQLLIEQGRHRDAEALLRRGLSDRPDDGLAHAFRGLCLLRMDQPEAAGEALRQALRLMPDHPLPHLLTAELRLHLNDGPGARRAADEAIRLDPGEADGYALRAQIEASAQRWAEAVTWAERGLARDAEHPGCANLRAMALTRLGRRDEASRAIDGALQATPDDHVAHANRGWAELHAGRPRDALPHFSEALRLQPSFEWARAGLVEALKARFFLYRWILGFFLWMSRLSPRVQVGVLVGGYVGYLLLRNVAANVPAMRPIVWPLIAAYFVFAILTWVSVPLFNLLLMLNRFGRQALSPAQTYGAMLFLGFMLLPIALIVLGFVGSLLTSLPGLGYITGRFAVEAAILMLPAAAVAGAIGTPRLRLFAGALSALLLLLLIRIGLHVAGSPSPPLDTLYLYGLIAAIWGMILLGGPTRHTMTLDLL